MTYIDISLPITPDLLSWPGDPPVEIRPVTAELGGFRVTVSELHLGSHAGTHVDAPRHFGLREEGVDRLPFEALLGPCRVLDLRREVAIGAESLRAAELKRVLLRTDNSAWIHTGPVPERPAHLTRAAAEWLVDRGVLLVGIDGLSVDASEETAAHEVLLSAGVVILEAIDLWHVEAGDYELLCLPLRLFGADGAPARAVLRR